MSKDIARNVALVTYGNVFLEGQGAKFDIDRLTTYNCYQLDFIEPPIEGIAGSTKILAKDAHQWFKYLKEQDAKRIKLHYETSAQSELPDHISAAFVGGGSRWFIEVQFEERSDLYLSDWVPPIDSGMDTRKTHYVRVEQDTNHLEEMSLSVADSREYLQSILEELSKFAGEFEHSKHWASNFESSLATLREFEPQVADEFLPADIYSKEAHQLIMGAFGSWVFGGMGSWNDMAFNGTDQERYESLSEKLYSTICKAIVSGVNSYP